MKVIDSRVESATTLIDEARAELNHQLEVVQKEMDGRDERAAQRFSEVEDRVTDALEVMADLESRLDTLIEKQQERFDNSLEVHREVLANEQEISRKSLEEVRQDQKQKGEALLNQMEEIKSKTRAVSSIVATATTSEAYRIEANNQRRNANWMRGLAICLLVVAAIVTIWWIWKLEPTETSDQALLVRLGLSLTLVGASVYCVRESAKHRAMEFENRSLELKLRALDPFIQPVNPLDREEIMLKAAHYFFGLNDTGQVRRQKGSGYIKPNDIGRE